ncbi:MAG TPA: hypothetical protein VMV14_11575 [Acidimicrobiales bacterium]|nr:hypothetical protein [Acidimicrobiales bacterium]
MHPVNTAVAGAPVVAGSYGAMPDLDVIRVWIEVVYSTTNV